MDKRLRAEIDAEFTAAENDVRRSLDAMRARYAALDSAATDDCCPPFTAEDTAALGLPTFGSIDGTPAIRWPDGRIETGPED